MPDGLQKQKLTIDFPGSSRSWTKQTENTKQIDVAEEACKIAEENLDLNTFSYNEGKLPILDVLSAQLSWIQSYSS